MSAANNNPIEVWILGGYLGAGKTTALNALLSGPAFADRNPALIINEFGRIGVDGALVERRELSRYEINKGSLFCICTKTDFLKALADIARADAHQAVLIEATGIAEPVDIESFLTDGPHAGRFRLRGNLCIVDAVNFTKVAAFLKPAVAQVQWADVIVINKSDQAGDAERAVLRRLLADLNPAAPICETAFGRIDPAFLDGLRRRRRCEALRPCAPEKIFAASFTADTPINSAAFDAALAALGDRLLRLKGNVAFADGPAFVELVCGRRTQKQPLVVLSEQAAAPTAFTAIAWNIEKDALRQAFADCGCRP